MTPVAFGLPGGDCRGDVVPSSPIPGMPRCNASSRLGDCRDPDIIGQSRVGDDDLLAQAYERYQHKHMRGEQSIHLKLSGIADERRASPEQ